MPVLEKSSPRYGLGGNKSQPRNFATRQKLVNENYKPLTDRGESNFSEPTSPAQREATFRANGDEMDANRASGFLQAMQFLAKKRSKTR
jgi:hypothetical protein